MARRGHLLCPCGRAELILDRLKMKSIGVPFGSLSGRIELSPPLLREM
jgi:hypothetical protein